MVTLKARECGLCGATDNLIKTYCCGEWVCDDEEDYQLFSYARNSCHRNHRRLTLCAYHRDNEHEGSWETCDECRKDFDTEDYVNLGTNDYNFRKLENPPKFDPTKCVRCAKIIDRMNEGYSIKGDDFYCQNCNQR